MGKILRDETGIEIVSELKTLVKHLVMALGPLFMVFILTARIVILVVL